MIPNYSIIFHDVSDTFHYWNVPPNIMYGEVIRSQWGSYNMTKHFTAIERIEALETLNVYGIDVNLCEVKNDI